eukprot:GHVS01089846.1.p1 GENE.GHVS01089846.1~~GHVS01089846.1.p1  ORF type:complete len:559 (+),score=48.72 GHVS01089846.1:70-1746(+)
MYVAAVVVWIIGIAIRLCWVYTTPSTDFEVHRNWLALTHSLPLRDWYIEDTSKWTLDYPPLFAMFEWLTSQAAVYFDPAMLTVQAEPYMSTAALWFQRLTVIFTELLLFCAILSLNCSATTPKGTDNTKSTALTTLGSCVSPSRRQEELLLAVVSTAFNGGLLIVDHIHFQYNGFLLGVLLLAASSISNGHIFLGAVLFTCLLNLKHIYLYVAPVVGLYLLRLCMVVPATAAEATDGLKADDPTKNNSRRLLRYRLNVRQFCCLGLLVCLVACACFLPVVMEGRLREMLSRLFPFDRGLVHAYWAPNVWALYLMLDRAILAIMKAVETSTGVRVLGKAQHVLSPTAGVTGTTTATVLPNISPLAALCATAVLYYPVLKLCWRIADVTTRGSVFDGSSTVTACLNETSDEHFSQQGLRRRRTTLQHQRYPDSSSFQPAVEPAEHGWFKGRQTMAATDPYFTILLAMGSGVVFLTGWHVHEKAVLTVTIPLGICVWKLQDPTLARSFFWLNTIATFSLLPLMHSKSGRSVDIRVVNRSHNVRPLMVSWLVGKDLAFSAFN